MINSVFRNRRIIHTIHGAMMIWICFGHCRGNRSEVSKNVNIIHFHEQKDKQFSFVDDLVGTINVSSKIECAHVCAYSDNCCASSFDHFSNICLLNRECNSKIESTLGSNVLTKTRGVSTHILKDCSDLPPGHYDGIYKIQPENGTEMNVYCDMTTDGGGWTVVQKRFNGEIEFLLSWRSYKEGFGNVYSEYWLGNDNIHAIVRQSGRSYKVRIDLEDFEGFPAFAEYSDFYVDSEETNYTLCLGQYSGNAGDSMTDVNRDSLSGMMFSALDRDNDKSKHHCSFVKCSSWWFNDCTRANINGLYTGHAQLNASQDRSVHWKTWQQDNSLKKTEMKIKPI